MALFDTAPRVVARRKSRLGAEVLLSVTLRIGAFGVAALNDELLPALALRLRPHKPVRRVVLGEDDSLAACPAGRHCPPQHRHQSTTPSCRSARLTWRPSPRGCCGRATKWPWLCPPARLMQVIGLGQTSNDFEPQVLESSNQAIDPMQGPPFLHGFIRRGANQKAGRGQGDLTSNCTVGCEQPTQPRRRQTWKKGLEW